MLTGSPGAFNEACSKSITLSSFLLHLGFLCPLPGSGHSLHGFVPRQFQSKRLQLAQLGIRLTDILPIGRGFLALPALICLLQAEQVAETWQ